ncbi:aldo/keto reductase [Catellatospora tritici]|uniref:aldo/keto reductase n=1 Tax=Catellatospora tritici TaxID=2851566 RepID=UPI001C2D646A|nr:aldo/keto reductase [Catellatospora tritici]MBV1848995.1 aldo/keto reductase [Catellatospora tritici]
MTGNEVTLNNGVKMPQLGFGVWQVEDDEAEKAVTSALEAGYRSIDTAKIYFNEEGTGRALRNSGLPRQELFVTTKLWNTEHRYDDALRAFDDSLDKLGLDYLDLYLIHWPVPSQDRYTDAWRAMEQLLADGRVRAIGVSNFTAETLTRLVEEFEVVPAINQIELHPYLPQRELRDLHAKHGVHTEAWSPLGQGKTLLAEPVLTRLADKHGKTPAQVVLRWHLQLGNVVIPKSVTPARIAENIDVFDFELDDEDLAAIATLDNGGRIGPDPATFAWMG